MSKPINVKGKGRHYKSPNTGKLVPSVTNILNCWPKQRALVPWAANVQKELDVEAAYEVYLSRKEFRDAEHFRQILDDHIGKRRKHKTVLEKAGNIGTAIHEAIAIHIRKTMGLPCEDNPTLEGPALYAYMSWEKWWEECDIEPLHVEKFVCSDFYGFAGTTDLVARVRLSEAILSHLSPNLKSLRVYKHLGETVTMDIDFKSGKAIYDDQWPQLAAYMEALESEGISEGILDSDSWGMIVRLPKQEDDPEFETGLLPPWKRQEMLDAFLAAKKIWEVIHSH